MPTYDYLCENCGHEFEQFQTIKARPLRKCPACKKTSLKRLIGAGSGLIFKGSGFYTTDYRSEDYKKQARQGKETAAGKTDTKTKPQTEDSKPSDKTKPKTEKKST
jgi:putative FmdB family regulatory protein